MVSQYPSESVRRKLVVAGIPESEHSVEALAAKIPDFSTKSFEGISADMLGELLLYFIAKGILSLPVTSDRALLDMPWGSHVCQFFHDKQDLIELLVPYFKQGLDRNEACVWIVGDLSVEEARTAMTTVVSDIDLHIASGQMTIKHFSEFYTSPNGSMKPSSELSSQIEAMGPAVRANGFVGLRASGTLSWVKDAETMSQCMDYEHKVNLAIQNDRIMAVCTYPHESADMPRCRELIHSHGKVFVKRGAWVHENTRDAAKVEALFASLCKPQPRLVLHERRRVKRATEVAQKRA
jgi:hypothetical protein